MAASRRSEARWFAPIQAAALASRDMRRDVRVPITTTDPRTRLRCHRYGALVEKLAAEPSFLVKPMFGCLACYAHGRLMLVLADRRPPWRGILVPTAHEHHAALRVELGALVVHPVLAKWLHVRESAAQFEETAACLVALACADDPRLGVEPDTRRRGAARKIRKRRSRVS